LTPASLQQRRTARQQTPASPPAALPPSAVLAPGLLLLPISLVAMLALWRRNSSRACQEQGQVGGHCAIDAKNSSEAQHLTSPAANANSAGDGFGSTAPLDYSF
jgi:hypothetical protein